MGKEGRCVVLTCLKCCLSAEEKKDDGRTNKKGKLVSAARNKETKKEGEERGNVLSREDNGCEKEEEEGRDLVAVAAVVASGSGDGDCCCCCCCCVAFQPGIQVGHSTTQDLRNFH